ncbi:hypothetical protein GCM10027578_04730 [Spirosoma luteolum]
MTNRFVYALGLALALSSCQPGEQTPCTATPVTVKAPDNEIATLRQTLAAKGITATYDDRGFFYTIKTPGKGAKPTICSNVTVNYTGKLTNGTTFDSGEGVSFGLGQLILGWQEGIPLVAPGGTVTLYLPPSLAYGPQEQSGIPANSILIFDIDLLSIN